MITLTLYKAKTSLRLPSLPYFTKIAEATLKACHKKGTYTLSLAFVHDAEMARLNEHWLQRKGPTDVLSFSGEGSYLGEVIINLDMLKVPRIPAGLQRFCKERAVSVRHMVVRSTVHGMLSLLGFDHKEGERAHENQMLEDTIVQGFYGATSTTF